MNATVWPYPPDGLVVSKKIFALRPIRNPAQRHLTARTNGFSGRGGIVQVFFAGWRNHDGRGLRLMDLDWRFPPLFVAFFSRIAAVNPELGCQNRSHPV